MPGRKLQPGRIYNAFETWHAYTEGYIHPDDRQRFMEFSSVQNLESRADPANHTAADYFRSRMPNGKYMWNFHAMIILPPQYGHKYLHVARICRYADPLIARQLIQAMRSILGNEKGGCCMGSSPCQLSAVKFSSFHLKPKHPFLRGAAIFFV